MKRKIVNFLGSQWGQRISLLVIIIIIMGIFQPKFFKVTNIYSILLSISIYGIMACGMLFTVLVGGIDLSVGSTAAMGAIFMVKYVMAHNYTTGSVIVGILIAMGICAVLGLFHGLEVAYLKIPAFVLTLATQYAIYGLMNVYTEAKFLQPVDDGLFWFIGSGRVLGVPMPVIIMVVFAALSAFVLGRTKFGRRVYMVGGNPVSAELIGVNSKFYKVIAFVICSISCAISGVVLACMNMQAAYTTASGYNGHTMTAMVVGGINLAGGEGGVPGAIFGALFVGIVNNLMILLNVPADYQDFVQGVIIVVAIAFNVYSSRKSQGLTGVDKKIFQNPKAQEKAAK